MVLLHQYPMNHIASNSVFGSSDALMGLACIVQVKVQGLSVFPICEVFGHSVFPQRLKGIITLLRPIYIGPPVVRLCLLFISQFPFLCET